MSQHAIKGSNKVSNDNAIIISNKIMKLLKDELNINSCVLGSTGKKKSNQYSGDIDIAIEYELTDKHINNLKNVINNNLTVDSEHIIPFTLNQGLKILSFGYYYTTNLFNEYDLVQVDLMFSNDLEYSKFMYHSPNYIKNESDFKGLYRTNLLCQIVSCIPTGIPEIKDENDNVTDFWKYTLTFDSGLKLTHKTYKGKTKLLKNPVTVKEDDKIISTDINEIIKIILGDKATIEDTNSFETLINYIFSDKFKYSSILQNIYFDFIKDSRHTDIKQKLNEYIFNVLINSFKDKNFIYEQLIEMILTLN